MKPMTLDEIRRRDLKRVCHHEAGHLVALTRLGGLGSITISEAENCDDLMLYGGRCQILMPPAAERGEVLVGLAGVIAEDLMYDIGVEAQEILEHIEESMSDSDARIASGYTPEDVERVLELLRENWADVQLHADNQVSKWEVLQ